MLLAVHRSSSGFSRLVGFFAIPTRRGALRLDADPLCASLGLTGPQLNPWEVHGPLLLSSSSSRAGGKLQKEAGPFLLFGLLAARRRVTGRAWTRSGIPWLPGNLRRLLRSRGSVRGSSGRPRLAVASL